MRVSLRGNKFIHSNNSISEEGRGRRDRSRGEKGQLWSTRKRKGKEGKRKKEKERGKCPAYGETYDASIIEREFPSKKWSSFRTMPRVQEPLSPPSTTNFLPNDWRKKWDRVGKRKKKEKRISSNNHAMTNKLWKENDYHLWEDPPLFFLFQEKPSWRFSTINSNERRKPSLTKFFLVLPKIRLIARAHPLCRLIKFDINDGVNYAHETYPLRD